MAVMAHLFACVWWGTPRNDLCGASRGVGRGARLIAIPHFAQDCNNAHQMILLRSSFLWTAFAPNEFSHSVCHSAKFWEAGCVNAFLSLCVLECVWCTLLCLDVFVWLSLILAEVSSKQCSKTVLGNITFKNEQTIVLFITNVANVAMLLLIMHWRTFVVLFFHYQMSETLLCTEKEVL